MGGGVRGQKGTWLTDRNDPGSQIPTYALVDATVAYVQPQYELRLNGNNLTDKLYYFGGYNNRPDRVAARPATFHLGDAALLFQVVAYLRLQVMPGGAGTAAR